MRLENPYAYRTKGEMLRLLESLYDLDRRPGRGELLHFAASFPAIVSSMRRPRNLTPAVAESDASTRPGLCTSAVRSVPRDDAVSSAGFDLPEHGGKDRPARSLLRIATVEKDVKIRGQSRIAFPGTLWMPGTSSTSRTRASSRI